MRLVERSTDDIVLSGTTHDSHPHPAPAPDPEPHRAFDLRGILMAARGQSMTREAVSDFVRPPLTDLVRHVTRWGDDNAAAQERIGDHRFLVVEFRNPGGALNFVQLWSEPIENILMEVRVSAGADTEPAGHLATARSALRDRGFEIGGTASNFGKRLTPARADDPPRIAREMLSVLQDVLGYDGITDLSYRAAQASRLQPDHVLSGMNLSILTQLLQSIGLNVSRIDQTNGLKAWGLDMHFRALLVNGKPEGLGEHWEVHFMTQFAYPNSKLPKTIERINSGPYLLKAFSPPTREATTPLLALTTAVNLCGGVTLSHIRLHLLEFLEHARVLRRD
jgi:hypothetical protein